MSPAIRALPDAVLAILTGASDWPASLERAARLAAATGKPLRVVLADGEDLVAASALDCVHLVASSGRVGAIDPAAARRLLRARRERLRGALDVLALRLGIRAELVEAEPAAVWAGCAALAVFGRRRVGTLLVVHAGSAATLDVAGRLALDWRQEVRLLSVATPSTGDLAGRFGHWLRQPPRALAQDRPLPDPEGARIAAVVLDPAYLAARQLTLAALLDELRTMMGGAAPAQAPSPT